MSLSSKVNLIFYDLETLKRKSAQEEVTSPKFETELRRLQFEVHRLHWEAKTVDEAIRLALARSKSDVYNSHAEEIIKRTYILRNEIEFIKSELITFTQTEQKNSQEGSQTLFSDSDPQLQELDDSFLLTP